VIEFAELDEFRDLKLKNYSSGMHVRLAFSVAIQVDADILLIDEVLAVGDAAFQQKCFDIFYRMREQGKTIVFVTHDMAALSRFCHRALLLERGSVVHLGDPQDVAERYMEINFGISRGPDRDVAEAWEGDARILSVWIEDEHGERRSVIGQGRRVTMHVLVAYGVDVGDARVSVYVHNEEQKTVLVLSSVLDVEHARFRAGESVQFSFSFDNVLAPGRYSPVVNLADGVAPLGVAESYLSSFSFLVTGMRALGGVVDLPTEVTVTRAERVTTPEAS
jgi:ABC-type multidrug transport system ATPase subunit